jgi:uncharacterized RDD family membrane protein YckC
MAAFPPNPALPDGSGDKLTIETPEQTSLEFALAGIGSRFLAIAVDTLIQTIAAAVLILGVILLFRVFGASSGTAAAWTGAAVLLILFLAYYGYFVFFESLWNGQTPGKRLVRIRVIKDDGRPIRTVESMGRNLLRLVDMLPIFYAVGIACVLLNRKGKRLGDFVAGTIVVHERNLEQIRPVWQVSPQAIGMRLGAEHLTSEDLTLVEAFLNRREALAPDVRYRTAAQIVDRIRPRLAVPEGTDLRSEALLEAVASERRSSAKYT